MTRHEAKLRKARKLLHEVFGTGKLDAFEEGCVRAAVSSLDGALHEVHPPIGTAKATGTPRDLKTWAGALSAVVSTVDEANEGEPAASGFWAKAKYACFEGHELERVLVKAGVNDPRAFMSWSVGFEIAKWCDGDGIYFDADNLRRASEVKRPKPPRCGSCTHRKWAGHCEECPDKTIDAHDGRDCKLFTRGDGLLNSFEEVEEYKHKRGIA